MGRGVVRSACDLGAVEGRQGFGTLSETSSSSRVLNSSSNLHTQSTEQSSSSLAYTTEDKVSGVCGVRAGGREGLAC